MLVIGLSPGEGVVTAYLTMAQPRLGFTQSHSPGTSGSSAPILRADSDQTCSPPSQFMRMVILAPTSAPHQLQRASGGHSRPEVSMRWRLDLGHLNGLPRRSASKADMVTRVILDQMTLDDLLSVDAKLVS